MFSSALFRGQFFRGERDKARARALLELKPDAKMWQCGWCSNAGHFSITKIFSKNKTKIFSRSVRQSRAQQSSSTCKISPTDFRNIPASVQIDCRRAETY